MTAPKWAMERARKILLGPAAGASDGATYIIRPMGAGILAEGLVQAHRAGWQAAIEALADAFKNLPAVSAAMRQIPYQPPEDRGDG